MTHLILLLLLCVLLAGARCCRGLNTAVLLTAQGSSIYFSLSVCFLTILLLLLLLLLMFHRKEKKRTTRQGKAGQRERCRTPCSASPPQTNKNTRACNHRPHTSVESTIYSERKAQSTTLPDTCLAPSVEKTEEQLEHHNLLVGEEDLARRGRGRLSAHAAFSRPGRRRHHAL